MSNPTGKTGESSSILDNSVFQYGMTLLGMNRILRRVSYCHKDSTRLLEA